MWVPFQGCNYPNTFVFSNDKLFGECWVCSKTCQLCKVSVGQLRSLCVVITPSTNMTHCTDNSGSDKIVVNCPRPNAGLLWWGPTWSGCIPADLSHIPQSKMYRVRERSCLPINLAHIAIAFLLKFPRDSMHFISIRPVPCTSENLSKQSNYQGVKMNPHQIYPLTQNWVMSAQGGGAEPLIIYSWACVSGPGLCTWLILRSLFTI